MKIIQTTRLMYSDNIVMTQSDEDDGFTLYTKNRSGKLNELSWAPSEKASLQYIAFLKKEDTLISSLAYNVPQFIERFKAFVKKIWINCKK